MENVLKKKMKKWTDIGKIECQLEGCCFMLLLEVSPTEAEPEGSTSLAICSASLVARSVLAGVTAKMRQVSLWMNVKIIWRICSPISLGWSPTGIFVMPGRSIKVIFNTIEK